MTIGIPFQTDFTSFDAFRLILAVGFYALLGFLSKKWQHKCKQLFKMYEMTLHAHNLLHNQF